MAHTPGPWFAFNADYEAKDRNRSASVIQGYWDGIGEWRW
jgi:hypothetical protein